MRAPDRFDDGAYNSTTPPVHPLLSLYPVTGPVPVSWSVEYLGSGGVI
jgi:hypothetical protein